MLNINTNLSGFIVQSSLKASANGLNQAIERMTTGFKINHAKDNAANFSINTKLSTKIGAYSVAEENAMMGLDMVQTAESSLSQISDGLSRMRALAIQAQNGTYGSKSLDAINNEANSLAGEINRIFKTAKYNGKLLLDTYRIEIPDDIGCQVDLTPKYNGFIENPVDYSEGEVAAMTSLAGVDEALAISSGQYSISGAEELAKFGRMVNSGVITGGEFVLANDIDMEEYLQNHSWVSIGTWGNNPKVTFNGNGCKIQNFSGNKSLFGVSAVVFKNLGMDNVKMTDTAPLANTLNGTTSVNNCYCTGEVNATNNPWQLSLMIGFSHQPMDVEGIKNCYTKGKITADNCSSVGGILGSGYRVNIENCFSDCEIVVSNGISNGICGIGGIVGSSTYANNLKNCLSTGSIVSDAGGVGGIAGSGAIITNCHSTMDVTGKTAVGGLIGYAGSIKNGYSTGKVFGETAVGGLVGELTSATSINVENCYSYGKVEGLDAVGSFVGRVVNTTDGINFKTINFKNCQTLAQDVDKLGGTYQNASGVYTSLDNYDMSFWLSEISSFYIPPEETTLQVGINSDESSSITFNTTVKYGSFDLLNGLKMEAAGTLELLDSIIKQVNEKQTEIGSIQNRLESVLEQVGVAYDNLVSTQSTIRDVDIAEVSSEYIRNQILQQASEALMAAANQTPSIALRLL